MISVERLRQSPADMIEALLAESQADGLHFLRRLLDDWSNGVNRFDRPGEALFIAHTADRVVGVCGLNVDPYAVAQGDQRVGRVRHLYVLSTYRRLGVGRQLVAEVLGAARGQFGRLHLRTQNPAAARLYERLGFQRRDGDTHCTHVIEPGRGASPEEP